MNQELVQTRDGSHTFYSTEFHAHYHSIHGAVSESMHVFIKNGLCFAKQYFDELNILEIGLGSGLNACLTFQNAGECEINYMALEPYPPDTLLLQELNYNEWIDGNFFVQIHDAPFDEALRLSSSFYFRKIQCRAEDYRANEKFHLIYFDAFAPNAQPELWTENIFSNIFQLMNTGGVLVTYCAKGDVKRAMKASGFMVETLPGAPGKREMTRAIKK